MQLLRYQLFLLYGVLFLTVWYMVLRSEQFSKLSSSSHVDSNDDGYRISMVYIAVQYAPIWAIVLLGLYAVSSVIYGVITFHDTPDAAAELEIQIQEAIHEMTRRGIITTTTTTTATTTTTNKKDK